MTEYLVYGIPAVALVMGLVKALREVGLPSKFAPLTSVGIGIVFGLIIAFESGRPYIAGVVIGIMLGLSSCGLYDVGKKTA